MIFSLKLPKRLSTAILTASILVGVGFGSASFAKDGFGLDKHKRTVESLTNPAEPYRTKFGNPIHVYTIKNDSAKKAAGTVRFLVQGGLHGNELLASEFVGWLAQRFANGESILNTINSGDVEIDFLPFANPDGTIQFTRYNGNKINLNRNFSILWGTTKENPGPKPFSESETRAIRDLFAARKYSGSIDVHGYVNWIVLPTSPDDNVQGFPGASQEKILAYKKWYEAVSRQTNQRMPGYEIKTAGALGDGGAFEDFAWWGANVPAACLEIFSQNRFVPESLAATIFDWITPSFLARNRQTNGKSDSFLVYESYMHSLFLEALKLNNSIPPGKELAGNPIKN